MNHDASRSDVPSLKQALLRSARLDAQTVPTSVRRRLLGVASVAGVTSAAASAGASWGVFGSSLLVGGAKWLAVGTLFVSVGAATFHGTRGVWHPQPIAGANASPPTLSEQPTTPQRSAIDGTSPTEAVQPNFGNNHGAALTGSPEAALASDVVVQSRTQPSDTASPEAVANSTLSRDRTDVSGEPPVETDPIAPSTVGEHSGVAPAALLTQELTLLDHARSRLAAGDPADTLTDLDAYAQQFPKGDLQPESLLLRVQALHQSGQRESARELGVLFLKHYPTSPHAKQVRALVELNQ